MESVMPVLFVAAMVVVVTQGDEVGEIGGSTMFPVANVVEFAHRDRGRAVGDCAGGMQSFNGPVLRRSS